MADLWPQRQARALTERVAADPERALARWARGAAAATALDPFGATVAAALRAGLPPGRVGRTSWASAAVSYTGVR